MATVVFRVTLVNLSKVKAVSLASQAIAVIADFLVKTDKAVSLAYLDSQAIAAFLVTLAIPALVYQVIQATQDSAAIQVYQVLVGSLAFLAIAELMVNQAFQALADFQALMVNQVFQA